MSCLQLSVHRTIPDLTLCSLTLCSLTLCSLTLCALTLSVCRTLRNFISVSSPRATCGCTSKTTHQFFFFYCHVNLSTSQPCQCFHNRYHFSKALQELFVAYHLRAIFSYSNYQSTSFFSDSYGKDGSEVTVLKILTSRGFSLGDGSANFRGTVDLYQATV